MEYTIESLTKDIAKLCMRRSFYASILMPLQKKVANCGTACTDGKSLIVDPNWFGTLNQLQRETVLMHEALHLILLHNIRRQNRNAVDWNIACDYAINSLLADDVHEFPDCGCIEPHLLQKYNGQSAEFIFADLIKESEDNQEQDESENEDESEESENDDQQNSDDTGGSDGNEESDSDGSKDGSPQNSESGQLPQPSKPLMGDVHDLPDMAEDSESEIKAKEKILQAKAIAKAMGSLPANIERAIEDIIAPPKLSWEEELKRWVEERVPQDWSWQNPDPIHQPRGFLMPTLDGNNNGLILVAIDTSASMDSDQLRMAMNELNDIVETQATEGEVNLRFVSCDTRCTNPIEINSADDIPKLQGGGGTRFRPVFEMANNLPEPPKAVIYLTDGYAWDFGDEPDYDVLWIITDDTFNLGEDHFPFGEKIELN